MEVDLRPSFSHLHQLQLFLDDYFQVLEVLKNWSPSYLKAMLIKMGPSNEDIWFLDFGFLDFALNNGNVLGQWSINGFLGF
jgi:hypothetical protein